jgi:Na+-translocating ferredoxin:NAD+ oxidoreductase subunit D
MINIEKTETTNLPGKELFIVTSSPHISGNVTVSKIMWTVSACLAPAGIVSIYLFGLRAVFVILLSIAGAMGAEYAWQRFTKRKITIKDGSAFLTGLLLAYNLSPSVDWWIPLLGSAFAIIIVKQFFGGLGMNVFNPALAARAFLQVSWRDEMSTWIKPVLGSGLDKVTCATPLSMVKHGQMSLFSHEFSSTPELFWKLFLGVHGGCIGETCSILLILGGIYLILKKYVDWQIPAAFIGATLLFVLFFGGNRGNLPAVSALILHLFSGGLILGAFFMATDYVTSPSTLAGRIVFGAGCGLITGIIRIWGSDPEGVCYAILIMNALTPIIDDRLRPRPYGQGKEKMKQ